MRSANPAVQSVRMAIRSLSHHHRTKGALTMATKSKPKSTAKPAASNKPAATKAKPAPKSAAKAAGMFAMPDATELAKYAKTLTPEQAFELYRANARLALDVIDAAIESTAKMRRLQFEGEETARTMQKKAARRAAEAGDVPSLMAAGQSVTQEAVERSMAYWGQMFELVVEIQKRLFTLMEDQMAGVPGVKQAKAAMAMMPDMTKMQNVVQAMQGVMSSGGSAFESMQKVMNDFARMTGAKR
jgi:phasin family protein